MIIESPEPYVDADKAAEFLSTTKREVLEDVRSGKLPGHPIDPDAQRKKWRFRLSELAEHMQAHATRRTIPGGSPRSQKGKP